MKRGHHRITLTQQQYWLYFFIPIILVTAAIILHFIAAYYLVVDFYKNPNISSLIWIGNGLFLGAFLSFRRRWQYLFYFELPIALSDDDFIKIVNRVSERHSWKVTLLNGDESECFKIDADNSKAEWIKLKRFKDKIWITSLTNPNRIHISAIFQNQQNLIDFKNSIHQINVPQFSFERKKYFIDDTRGILYSILKILFYLLVFAFGAFPFCFGIGMILTEGHDIEALLGGFFIVLYGSIMLLGLYKILTKRSKRD